MTTVGIVGTGISGLTLALRLQQLGVDATVYAETSAEDFSRSRLPNTVARFRHTLAREQALGIDHSPYRGWEMTSIHFSVAGAPGLAFRGDLGFRMQAVDFRVLLPQLMEAFESRGGRVVVTGGPPTVDQVDAWSAGHDLVVVGVGRRSMAELFPPDPSRSPYQRPQRSLCAGLYTGMAAPEPLGLSLTTSSGAGEVFQMPMSTRHGPAFSVLFEAVPGGPLEAVTTASYADDPDGFLALVRRLLGDHAPAIADRVEPGEFALTGPDDLLQGAVTPVVRRAWAELPSGRLAVAVGDAWITNDPITGQGANLGSWCGWTAAGAIARGGPFDAGFGRRLEDEMWRMAGPVTWWTNSALQPPSDHLVGIILAAAENQATADAFFALFDDPVRMWGLLSDPERAAAFAAGQSGQSGAVSDRA